MKTRIIEASQDLAAGANYGKFLIAQFDREWEVPSVFGSRSIIGSQGWGLRHHLVLDLATGEGALFPVDPRSKALADLEKHRIWVCVLFPAFLEWLYTQAPLELDKLPATVELPHVPAAFAGKRYPGPDSNT